MANLYEIITISDEIGFGKQIYSYYKERIIDVDVSIFTAFDSAYQHIIKKIPALIFIDSDYLTSDETKLLNISLAAKQKCCFIASKEYFGIEAFQFNAISCLLKPVNEQQLKKVVEKYEQKTGIKRIKESENWLNVKSGKTWICLEGDTYQIQNSNINFIENNGNLLLFNCVNNEILNFEFHDSISFNNLFGIANFLIINNLVINFFNIKEVYFSTSTIIFTDNTKKLLPPEVIQQISKYIQNSNFLQ